jgi:dTDP-glucose 4,6-dehydratase
MIGDTLKGKRVLVTGADGFIGSHLVEELAASGATVRALVYYNSWNSIGWLSDCSSDILEAIEVFPGDIRDAERVGEAAQGCEYVFHLSSLIAIPYSYHAPRSYVETNVIGALNVLEACRHSDALIRLLHTSTSEVYGSAQHIPINEDHPLVGQSPYSASKIGADQLAESYHRSFGLPVIIARPFNTFGPRQTARAVIPTIASQLISGCRELTMGAVTPTRDFSYVADTVQGIMALSECAEAEGQIVNIGTGEEWSIEAVARMLMTICQHEAAIIAQEERIRPGKSEVNRLLCDNRKLKDLTGWQPQVKFEEGLTRTVAWISKNLHLFNPDRYNI